MHIDGIIEAVRGARAAGSIAVHIGAGNHVDLAQVQTLCILTYYIYIYIYIYI